MMMMMNDTTIVATMVTPTHRPDYRAAANRTPWIDLSPLHHHHHRHHHHPLILMNILIIYYWLHLLIHTKVLYCVLYTPHLLFLTISYYFSYTLNTLDDSLSNLCVIDYYEDDQFFCNGDHDDTTNYDIPVESFVSYPGGHARNDTYVYFTHTDLAKYGMQPEN
jgi:hypothetical protein